MAQTIIICDPCNLCSKWSKGCFAEGMGSVRHMVRDRNAPSVCCGIHASSNTNFEEDFSVIRICSHVQNTFFKFNKLFEIREAPRSISVSLFMGKGIPLPFPMEFSIISISNIN